MKGCVNCVKTVISSVYTVKLKDWSDSYAVKGKTKLKGR